ncbi:MULTISPECIES: response regulator [Kordiimonas]|uniref:CheY chemotaxis protein or a CheY-like REC (Receiver) domain n=1 Tax=Kordiimonas lacus TaxID=637679 RepID=A0A1G6XWM1_9PROT|nr:MULTISPECIES: response regulator [Kordiimonas]SDD82634.1 CheY chemotaxis protein or a CheY-like REC (receiver) domain [Kordiimonas lacus]
MKLGEKSDLRVLIAMANGQAAVGARAVFKEQGAAVFQIAENNRDAMEKMNVEQFNLLLVEDTFPDIGGIDFCRFIRMMNAPISVAPIIYAMKDPDRESVNQARNAGVTKMVVMPFTTASLIKNLDDILLRPKPFIRVTGYYGPDRRVGGGDYSGPERRKKQQGVFAVANQKKVFKGL